MKSSNKQLVNNTFHLYILTIVKMLLPLVTLPYLARVLSKDAYGVVTYVKTWMQYVQLLIDFGFILSSTRLIVECNGNKKKIGNIIGDTLIEKCILSIVALLILVIAVCNIKTLKEYSLFVFIYYVSIFLTVFMFDFLFRGIEEMEKLSIPLIVSKIISTCLTFIFVKNDSHLELIALLEIIGNLIAVIISLYFIKQKKIIISFSNYKKWFRDIIFSFNYFLSNFSTTVFGALTTVITGIYLNTSDVASWGLCMQIVNAVKSIYSPIINGLYPYMIKNKNIKLINRINLMMGVLIFIGCIIVFTAGRTIIVFIAGDKYYSSAIILLILLPVLIFSFYSMIYGWPVLGAIKKIRETTITTVFSALVQIVLIVFLIVTDKFNLFSLAIITSFSEFLLFVTRYIVYRYFRYLFK